MAADLRSVCFAEEDPIRVEAKAVFVAADKDGNHSLSYGELKKHIQKDPVLRERLSANKWKVFMAEVDADGAVATCFVGLNGVG